MGVIHMPEEMQKRMYEEKRDFVDDLAITLKGYNYFGIADIRYLQAGWSEYVRIEHYITGTAWLNVNGDSLAAILKAITAEITDGEPMGYISNHDTVAMLEARTEWEVGERATDGHDDHD